MVQQQGKWDGMFCVSLRSDTIHPDSADFITPIAQRFHVLIHVSTFKFSLYPRVVHRRHYIHIQKVVCAKSTPDSFDLIENQMFLVPWNDMCCKRDWKRDGECCAGVQPMRRKREWGTQPKRGAREGLRGQRSLCGGPSAKDFWNAVRVDVFVLSRVIQCVVEMDVIGYHCARVVFNERKEKDNYYERRTTDETTDECCTRT